MHIQKTIFFILVLAVVGGCAANGPIKAYHKDAAVDKGQLSIIYLPPAIEMLEVDGIETSTPFIEEGYNEVLIPPGHHQIAVKYVKFWGDASSGSLVSSKPVIYSLNIKAKSKYYMKYTRPKDSWAAQEMVSTFSPWVEDQNGVKLKVEQTRYAASALTSGGRSETPEQFIEGKNPLEKLKFWWNNASYDEKQAFKNWLEED